jgi:hypothetical protein
MMFCCMAAALPVVIMARNVFLYRPLGQPAVRTVPSVSVLVPARNEEENIRQILESVLRCESVDLEVLVWDDGSTDRTAQVVRSFELNDARVRLLSGVGLPAGWAGKQHACQRLSEAAKGDVLVFLDADVRLRRSDALWRIAGAFLRRDLDLLSGVPLQRTDTFFEKLIVPMIHFVLLGFLPIDAMRKTRDPGFAAGCGQLMAFRASVYREMGGHAAVRGSFHEGITLTRLFRAAGKTTELFDAQDLCSCRMYRGVREVWDGFAKNAHEGLASPKSVLPMSGLLFFGQVVPFLSLLAGGLFGGFSGDWAYWALAATGLGIGARAVVSAWFSQPLPIALLQPFAVLFLLLNQWYGAIRTVLGMPVGWRGRTVARSVSKAAANAAMFCLFFGVVADGADSVQAQRCPSMHLEDQHARAQSIQFPRERPGFLVIAGRQGTGEINKWVKPVRAAFGESVDIIGLADVHGIPGIFRPAVRAMVKKGSEWPVLMDWTGETVGAIFMPGADIEVLVVSKAGQILTRVAGPVTEEGLQKVKERLAALVPKGAVAK